MIHEFERAVLYTGDSLVVLPTMPENSVHACVTDPPYELTSTKRTNPAPFVEGSPFSRHRVGVNGDSRPQGGFMGKEWDGTGIAFSVEFWAQVLRVLKPGAHLLAFGGTRTHHRMVCAIEDAGFEIRDEIDWNFGSGFPKSSNQDGEWEGWGTALKPAKEPICLARKPLIGTVSKNLQAHGTGALNIDACRVDGGGGKTWTAPRGGIWKKDADADLVDNPLGRWPANIIHDGSPEVVAAFPDSKGQQGDIRGTEPSRTGDENTACYGEFGRVPAAKRNDTGSAARFFKQCPFTEEDLKFAEEMRIFYCAKASKADREEGCDGLPLGAADLSHKIPRSELDDPRRAGTVPRRNHHPTVKPEALMRYLCRLITPRGGGRHRSVHGQRQHREGCCQRRFHVHRCGERPRLHRNRQGPHPCRASNA